MEKRKNYAHSVKQKLLDLSRRQNEDFQLILTKYALERFIARLALSKYSSEFILKGAMLFQIWSEKSNRATRDLDFLSFGKNDAETQTKKFRNICSIKIPEDGIAFDLSEIKSGIIKADQVYEGVRIQIPAYLERTKIALRIDVGFGDVVTPEIRETEFPTLLDFPEPKIRTYPPETVIAEKFQALVDLGMTNSRLKDFYDLYFLTANFQISGESLINAVKATFERRKTEIPSKTPIALTEEFVLDKAKQMQWKSFLKKSNIGEELSLETVVGYLSGFFADLLDFDSE